MNWDPLRPGQRDAIQIIERRFVEGEPYTTIVLPCRYGKSDVLRLAAYRLWADGYCPFTLAMSPNVVLRDQLGDKRRWDASLNRYGIDGSSIKIRTLEVPEWRPNAQGEMFLSVTMQSVDRNREEYRQWIRSAITATGKPPLIAVDEGHMGSEANTWGEVAAELVEDGARVVIVTATPMRADGKRIRGLDYEVISEKEELFYTTRKHEDPDFIWVQQRTGTLRRMKIIPNCFRGFDAAWEEGCLCHVNHIPFDINLSLMEGTDHRWSGMLSELKGREKVQQALSAALKDLRCVRAGVESFVEQLSIRRRELPDAAGIVFVGNDDDRDDPVVNKYANQAAALIRRLAPELVVVVATSADSGKDRLESFSEDGGRGDVLIVKQMAGLGLDVPRLKVVLDLSPIRTAVAWIQRILRAATPYKDSHIMDLICPDDLLSREDFDVLIEGQGGAVQRADIQLIKEWPKELDEEPESYWAFNGTDGAAFDDNNRNWAEKEKWQMVQDFLRVMPGLANHYTAAYLANSLKDLPWKRDEAAAARLLPGVIDTGQDAQAAREEINAMATDIATTRRRLPEWRDQTFGDVIRAVYTEAYREARVPVGVELKRIGDSAVLARIRAAMVTRLIALGRQAR